MKSSFTKCYISSFLMQIEYIFCFILFFVLFYFVFSLFFALQIFNSFGILYYEQAILFHSGGWSKPVLSITMERNIETFNITGKTETIQCIIVLIRKNWVFLQITTTKKYLTAFSMWQPANVTLRMISVPEVGFVREILTGSVHWVTMACVTTEKNRSPTDLFNSYFLQ